MSKDLFFIKAVKIKCCKCLGDGITTNDYYEPQYCPDCNTNTMYIIDEPGEEQEVMAFNKGIIDSIKELKKETGQFVKKKEVDNGK